MVPVGKFISYCICYFPSVVFIFETFIIYPISPLFLLEKRKQQANLGMPGRKGVQLAVLAFQPGQEVVLTNLPFFSSVEAVVDGSARPYQLT